ncbi:hypothetical protein [Halorientalis marina]|uniref:hypothetical protein n=1 Tax=Halorientalis marina TaxID=2931976 RepID=UPI001FF687C9|nr:hypothetical protein [Halorientalis marina]
MTEGSIQLTNAYIVGIKLRAQLRDGTSLEEAISTVDGPFGELTDLYPDWHPAPYCFEGIVRLFIYREITGDSYRKLSQYPELADVFGLECSVESDDGGRIASL